MKQHPKKFTLIFDRFCSVINMATGRPSAFLLAVLSVVVWALSGPLFNYSQGWQLTINTGTTIITFLMVFIIQQSQNKETMAVQLKLNELIAADTGTSNRLISIEDLTEEDLRALKKFYLHLAKLSAKEIDIHKSHSIDEAVNNHTAKIRKLIVTPKKNK